MKTLCTETLKKHLVMKKDFNIGTFWFILVAAILFSLATLNIPIEIKIFCFLGGIGWIWQKRMYTYNRVRAELGKIFRIGGYYRNVRTGQDIEDMFKLLIRNADDPVWREIINERIRSNFMKYASDAREFFGELRWFAEPLLFDEEFLLAPEIKEYWRKAQELAVKGLDEAIQVQNATPSYVLSEFENCVALIKGSPSTAIETPEYQKLVTYLETVEPGVRRAAIIAAQRPLRVRKGEQQLQTQWKVVTESLLMKFWQ